MAFEEHTLTDFSLPVHKSMHQPDLLLGIPKMVMMIIICFTIVIVTILGPWYFVIAIVLYIPCYFISKSDPSLLTIALDNLLQVDRLEG
jgi:type IV secretory pathway VirB3-like protein